MKKILSAGLLFMSLQITASAQKYSIKSLVGRWDSQDGGGIEILDSSRIYIVYGNEKKRVTSFEADFSKTPCWFDFTIRDSSRTMALKSLLLVVNDDLLQWEVFDDGNRPSYMGSGKGEMVYLRKRR